MANETTEQKGLLKVIEKEAALLATHQHEVDSTRRHLWELMAAAKEAKVSSYSIASAVGISQPRVMQIIQKVAAEKAPVQEEEEEVTDVNEPEPTPVESC